VHLGRRRLGDALTERRFEEVTVTNQRSRPPGSEVEHDVRLLHDQRVAMRDGKTMSADVYLPRTRGPFPTLYQWTPYESTRDISIEWGVWFAQRGYAAVVQDVRGKYESEGVFEPYRNDGLDGVDSLEWATHQAWCNGRIGTWGRSYGAIAQWQTAFHGHPALHCMAPHVINDDYFDEGQYAGGAFQLALYFGAMLVWSTTPGAVGPIGAYTAPSAGPYLINERILRTLPLTEIDVESIGRRVSYWRDWLEHQTNDDYWHAVSHRGRYHLVNVPLFQQGGWFDPYTQCLLRMYDEMRANGGSDLARAHQKVLIGPWSHEENVGSSMGELDFGVEAARLIRADDLRWYDQWLRELDTGILDEPQLSLFVMGENRWRHEHQWPLRDTEFAPLYLHSDGAANRGEGGVLSRDAPGPQSADVFAYDPNDPVPTIGGVNSVGRMMSGADDAIRIVPGPFDQRRVEARDDVVCYTTAPLERDTEITGPVEVVLYAASSALDTDFVVRLSDVHPDGRSIGITEGIVRAAYRNGSDRRDPLEPREPTELRIACYPTSMVFARGHRVRLVVTSSWFPRFARNLNTFEDLATATRAVVARQTVLHSAEFPSRVILPIVPR
jgi:putative CocE/NonD family hydrolase